MNRKLVKGLLMGSAAVLGAAGAVVGGAAAFLYAVAFSRKLPKGSEKVLGMPEGPVPEEERSEDQRRHDRNTEAFPARLSGWDTSDWRITAEDGEKLYGTMVWSRNGISEKTVVLVHGFHGSPAIDFGGIAPFYHETGVNILLVNDRGHEPSGGRFLGFGWRDRRDIVLWTKQIVKLVGADSKILLHGVSMGAAAVMMASGEEDLPEQVKGIVEDCGFTSVQEEFMHVFPKTFAFLKKPVIAAASLYSKILNGFFFSEASAEKQLEKNTRPVLFIHGSNDDFVPTNMVYDVYNAARGEKELYICPDAAHALSFDHDPETYSSHLASFMEKYI